MKIAIIGASGFVGTSITNEALNRGNEVTALTRHPETLKISNDDLHKVEIDVNNIKATAEALKGHDLVISAYNAGWANPNLYNDFISGSKALQEAVKESGVKRFIVIGGAGSLYVAEGLQAVDTPDFPEAYKAGATAARDYLNILKEEKDLDWVFFSPAFEMGPHITAGRTGKYRLGKDQPIFDSNNQSKLSVEDLAVVILDEAEKSQHHQERFTAAY